MQRNVLLHVLTILAVLLLATPARADCVADGQSYPEGTRSGVYVCENGQWVFRPD
jgi:hypothetical protein